MCCVNGLPMQVGLNMLLQQAKPDRLLIEPTGLGHPKQILSLLTRRAMSAGSICRPRCACWMPASSANPVTATTKTSAISWPRPTLFWPAKRYLSAGRQVGAGSTEGARSAAAALLHHRARPSGCRAVVPPAHESCRITGRAASSWSGENAGAGGAAIAGARPLAASAERGARLHQLRLDF